MQIQFTIKYQCTFIIRLAEIFSKDQKNEYKEWQVEPEKKPDFNKHYGRCEWQGLSKGLKKGGITEALSVLFIW